MSYAHMHAVFDHFNGTTAERLVLLVYALSIDYDTETKRSTGVTDPFLTVVLAAKRAGMHPRNVRAIIRRYEGTTAGQVEEDKWFYPVGGKAKQGQVTAKRYWMPAEPLTTAPVKRAARNPLGINCRTEDGSSNRGERGRLLEPTTLLQEPPQGLQKPTTNGSSNLPRTVTETDKYPCNTLSIPGPGDTPPPPGTIVRPGDRLRELAVRAFAERQSSPPGTPLPGKTVGGDAPKPPEGMPQTGMQEAGHTGPDPESDPAVADDLAEITEPTLITDHQETIP